ncbi:MAG: branched-chain amino acid ABC transporter permease [Deltaproteobacteria bacterium]|nr:branched-chain amino acid ABC transporter permease [Deltaproteobacteria bacterium]
MVKFELKRDRILLRWGVEKLEWCIAPRYWRNPIIGVALLLVLPVFFYSFPHLLTMLTTANLLAAVAIPLGLQILGTARVNFGPQLYLGIGGYTAALLNLHFGWSPFFTLIATIVVCGSIALLLSPTTWIAKGLYFSLITLILPLTFLDLTYQFGDLFRGEVGLFGMSALLDLGRVRWNYMAYYYLSLFLMLFYMLIADKIGRSRFGVTLAAINENEDVARMMGVDVSKYKVFYYVLPSIMTGIVGWFIVHTFRSFAGVTYLPLDFMLKVLIIVVIGGRAFVYGAVPGAYVVAIVEEVLRGFGHINQWLFPLALIALIFILPRGEGLWGLYHKRHPRDYFPRLHVRRE